MLVYDRGAGSVCAHERRKEWLAEATGLNEMRCRVGVWRQWNPAIPVLVERVEIDQMEVFYSVSVRHSREHGEGFGI